MQQFDMVGAIAGHRMLETFIRTDDVPAMEPLLLAYFRHMGIVSLVGLFLGSTERLSNHKRTMQGLEHLLELCCTLAAEAARVAIETPAIPLWHLFRLPVIQEEHLIVRPAQRSRYVRDAAVMRFHERYLRHIDAIVANDGRPCVFLVGEAAREELVRQQRADWQELIDSVSPRVREQLRRSETRFL